MSKNKNVKKKEKKSKRKPLSRGNILSFVQIGVVILVGCITIMVTRNISKTANLLYIQNDIQNRTDAVLSITDELDSYYELFSDSSKEEEEHIRIIENKEKDAVIALLRAYEFACRLYIKRNVDRKEFKYLYGKELSYTFNKYENRIGSGYCLSIREVLRRWQ